jgi:methyl-accepting chemotaxis protein
MRVRIPIPFKRRTAAAPGGVAKANPLAAARAFAQRSLGDLQTLVGIGLLFAVPILLLSIFLLRNQNDAIEHAERERRGQAYAVAVSRLVSAVPLHRDLTSRLLAGDASVQAALGRAAAEVGVRIREVDALTALYGRELQLTSLWTQLRAQWTLLEAEYNTLAPVQNYEAHTRLMAGVNNFLVLIAERSGLLLDADERSYFLIVSEVLGLPSAISHISGLRLQGYGAGRDASQVEREIATRTAADARSALQQVALHLDAAFAADADGREALEEKAGQALSDAQRLLDQADSAFPGRAAGTDPGAWFQATSEVIERLDVLQGSISHRAGALLQQRAETLTRGRTASQGISAVFALLALLGMLVLGRNMLRRIKERQHEAELLAQHNQRNQDAILRLMDEMALIADGDLTAQARVTEDITGAIADSVNVTVGELRKVVENINEASEEVAGATDEAQKIAVRLLAAAQRQAQDIGEADGTVEQMTRSITEVSETAAESANFAEGSIATTERGTQAVQESISGMKEIRVQIQDTAKRIKRLGESTQEIGEIVDLISDITEQTNVLALNAAIQAASAGEAGRGFTVVAEEVQRLAERSGEATKQIAALVKAIQADTQEAVAAMERSTQGVVEGARLTDAAGQSLQEIEEITRSLAELMRSIASSTHDQVAVAEQIRGIMREVLGLTTETTDGTQRTASSVGQLAALAQDLKGSVRRFKVA